MKNNILEKERIRRNIKRMTRHKYSLKNEKCYFCPNKAEERHHTTQPIQVNEFEFMCKDCHKKIHILLKKYKKKRKNENKI